MSYARDELFKGYMRKQMAVFTSTVKVREIVPHLPCLTLSDREEIEAKRQNSGNYAAMQTLLDCLRRRENWPEELITALEACEHPTLAAEIRAEYNSLKGHHAPNPSSSQSTVVMAHVHSPPSVSPALQPALAPPPAGPDPPEAADSPWAAQSPASPPEPQIPPSRQVMLDCQVPPTSPETRHPAPPNQEPEENSEVDLAGSASGPDKTTHDVGSEVTAEARGPAQTDSDWLCSDASAVSTETLGSASVLMTPEKLPVQDSEPPGYKAEISEPTQVLTTPQPTSTPPVDCVDGVSDVDGVSGEDSEGSEDGVGGVDVPNLVPSHCDEEDSVCLSKPEQLLSVQPRVLHLSPLPTEAVEEPYSGDIGRLEISSLDPESLCSPDDPAVGDADVCWPTSSSPPICYTEEEEVLENVGHVAKEPSIQNHASPTQGVLGNAVDSFQSHDIVVQSLSPSPAGDEQRPPQELQPQFLNGKANAVLAHERDSAPSQSAMVELVPRQMAWDHPEPNEASPASGLSTKSKYILTAAGVVICAVLAAWRLKN